MKSVGGRKLKGNVVPWTPSMVRRGITFAHSCDDLHGMAEMYGGYGGNRRLVLWIYLQLTGCPVLLPPRDAFGDGVAGACACSE